MSEQCIELNALARRMAELGATRFLAKKLAENDNSKNQIYVGGSSDVFASLPPFSVTADANRRGVPSFKAALGLAWIADSGEYSVAPGAQLVYYPQYPEVRLSGFLRGSSTAPMDVLRSRSSGRVLVLGISPDRQVFAFACGATHPVAKVVNGIDRVPDEGVFHRLDFGFSLADNPRTMLLRKICRIAKRGWMKGKRLRADGSVGPCNSPNCGGYTLEAEFDIRPNSYAEPDYLGWEVKSFGVSSISVPRGGAITLMTPEPNGGYYVEFGVGDFIRRYGYPDVSGREDRLNFGGVHRIDQLGSRTGLAMELRGFDHKRGHVSDAEGCLALIDPCGEIAASWSFKGLLEHWMRKHARAVFVPSERCDRQKKRHYRFGRDVFLGEETEFSRLLMGIAAGRVYYDPGLKLEGASTSQPRVKRRSQFRVNFRDLHALYKHWEPVDACAQWTS